VPAVEAIDELERIFARQYQEHRDALAALQAASESDLATSGSDPD